MKTRTLGTDLTVSSLGLGCMGISQSFGPSPERPEMVSFLRQAVEHGVTFFDTAEVYGPFANEEIVGEALEPMRDEVVIATKFGFALGDGEQGVTSRPDRIRTAVEGSLRRLRTDHIDLYQAHRYDHETPLEETMVAFADLVRSGKVLYIGVSEWDAEQITAAAELAAELRIPFISNQPQYSLLWRVIESEVVPASTAVGVGQIVWSPIAQGVLTGKYRPGEPVPEGSRATDDHGGAGFVQRLLRDEVLEAVQAMKPLVDAAGITMAQYAVAWVLRNPDVGAAIVGASRPEQLTENVVAAEITLDDDLVAAVDAVLEPVIERDPRKTVSPPTRP